VPLTPGSAPALPGCSPLLFPSRGTSGCTGTLEEEVLREPDQCCGSLLNVQRLERDLQIRRCELPLPPMLKAFCVRDFQDYFSAVIFRITATPGKAD